ncbi:MAG TPA: pyridoxal phosphate-dependent aminotransferase [Solirubrobacteraceae bacterium]|nr:pyridoxal phosphate-dependent aminotransferase [Solirubrobacteraceae bacterium]
MSVLTWTSEAAALESIPLSERLRRLRASHHAMWNYVTYRDAIALLGLDPAAIYPKGSTRLDPAEWADLGWLTCFCGPPASAVDAMRAAATAESLNQYTPDLIEPLRDAAAAAFGRSRDGGFEVVGTEGTQAAVALALMATVDPGDEVIVSDPGYFHIPSAVLAAGGVPVAVTIGPDTGYRLDPADVARAITTRTRAICIVDPLNPYGTVQTREELVALAELADRHGLLLVHDVTHAPIGLDPDAAFASLPALELTDRAVAAMSVSHCYGMAGARIGFLGGPPGFVRGCLQLKAALTRLNTNLISQHGALAALNDESYLAGAARTVAGNLAHLQRTLESAPGVRLVVRPERGLACAIDVSGTGASAQELMVALFACRVAVYPGDGLGDTGAASTIRINLSRPDPWAMVHLRSVLADAVDEAASGRWREPVVSLLERKGTDRAARLARQIGGPG